LAHYVVVKMLSIANKMKFTLELCTGRS